MGSVRGAASNGRPYRNRVMARVGWFWSDRRAERGREVSVRVLVVMSGVGVPLERPGDCFRAWVIEAHAVEASAGRRDCAAGWSGSGGERADRVEHRVELVLPGPAGWHPQRPLAAGAGQARGDLEEVAAA